MVGWAVLLRLAGDSLMCLQSVTGVPGGSARFWGLGRPTLLVNIVLQQPAQAFAPVEGRGIKEEAEVLKSFVSLCTCIKFTTVSLAKVHLTPSQSQCGRVPQRGLDRGQGKELGRLMSSICQDKGQNLRGSN